MIYWNYSASAVGLHEAAVAKGLLFFGSATDNPELTDAPYLAQLSNVADFGQITPGNSQKVCKSNLQSVRTDEIVGYH